MWRASRIAFLAHHEAAFVADQVHGRRRLSPTTDEGLIVNIASEDPSTEEGMRIKHLGIEEKCLEIAFHKHCEGTYGNAQQNNQSIPRPHPANVCKVAPGVTVTFRGLYQSRVVSFRSEEE